MSELYYIASLKHTGRNRAISPFEPRHDVAAFKTRGDDIYVCFWRPINKGYALPLSWAGKYTAEHVLKDPRYYNNGETTLSVRCDVVDALAVAPLPGIVDGNAGPVVPNTRASWDAMLAALVAPPVADPAARVARLVGGASR